PETLAPETTTPVLDGEDDISDEMEDISFFSSLLFKIIVIILIVIILGVVGFIVYRKMKRGSGASIETPSVKTPSVKTPSVKDQSSKGVVQYESISK
ncbi:hypothetical protein KAT36_04170, partial [Candidatus Pacearchaeota archaeon]|nr:hypothetical protein [Candidatus Pacearchaeota archaeon]